MFTSSPDRLRYTEEAGMSPKQVAKPVDIYVRVSTTKGREGDSFQSPKQQEDRCRQQLAADGLQVGKVFTDLDQSGGKTSRPAFDQALARARSGESGGIIVHDLTRFGRYSSMAQDIISLEENGAVFISCAEKIDTTTSSGRFFLRVMEAMAVMYREDITDRIAVSKQAAVDRGIHITRHAPPGYRRAASGRLEPDGKNAATVSKMFEMAANGIAPTDIARYLNEQGLPSGDNLTPVWKSSRIKRLLGNRVYLGEARANGSVVNPDAHPPLTDLATWSRAQRKPTAQPLSTSTALLSGLVRCACCRHSMKHGKGSSHSVRMYRCGRKGECPHPSSISAHRLEEIVLEAYADRLFSSSPQPVEQDDSEALAAVETAKAELEEVEAAKAELSPLAYGRALDAALAVLESAEAELVSRRARSDIDAEALLPDFEQQIASLAAGGSLVEGMSEEGVKLLRHALAQEIQFVAVRPPAKRSKSLPISDRIKIVWREDETPELPTRGQSKTFEPLVW